MEKRKEIFFYLKAHGTRLPVSVVCEGVGVYPEVYSKVAGIII